MGKRPRQVSLRDVARRARVSSMTVSRALRMPKQVAAATQRKVERAIADLGYLPNSIAGGLRSSRSRTVACVIPTIASRVFANVVQGMTGPLDAEGYRIALGTSNYDSAEERRVVADLLAHRPEALVLPGGDHRPELGALLARLDIPVVEIWERLARPYDMNVGFSNEEVGRAATRHLIERGARRVAFVGVTTREHARARARRRGYERTVGALLGHAPIIALAEESTAGGRQALRELLARDAAIDAIFFVDDVLAIGGLLEAQAQAIAVPGRLRIAGFGDLEIGRHLPPGLTTVRVPEHELGRRTAELLLGRLRGTVARSARIDIAFEIVARGSSA